MPLHKHGHKLKAYKVAKVKDIPLGTRLIIEINKRSIGIFNVNGKFYALRNLCPHQQAPLCEGRVSGTTLPSKPGEYILGRKDEILRCPWHAWEFDITTGKSLFAPNKCRVKHYPVSINNESSSNEFSSVETYPVTIQDADVFIHV